MKVDDGGLRVTAVERVRAAYTRVEEADRPEV